MTVVTSTPEVWCREATCFHMKAETRSFIPLGIMGFDGDFDLVMEALGLSHET